MARSTMSTNKSRRVLRGSHVDKQLENEAKGFLNSSNTYNRRARAYYPTLKDFQSVSFDDFIRYTLLQDNGEDDESDSENDGGCENVRGSASSPKKEQEVKEEEEDDENQESEKERKNEKKEVERPRTRHFAKQQNGNTTKVTISPNISSPNNKCTQNHNGKSYCYKNKIKISEKKWSDGIAKVCLPKGFWDYSGVGKDSSGRGPKWQKGSKNGDLVINSPIKQCCSGIGGAYEFALITQSSMTVAEFRKKADEYRDRQLGKDFDPDVSDDHMDELAGKFWKRLGPTMEPPLYGADMDGPSLFNKQYACGWNIEYLDSCLQLLTVDSNEARLPGVTSPYLYVGMWGATFAAHTEDMNLCSINYLHAGAPKYWYAIAPKDSKRFESLASSHFAEAAQTCPEFLRHKRYLISPTILRKAGIPYTTQIQRPGDAIITIPGSYHFGFNTGFNVAESTNFAVPEWIDSGLKANVCMCSPYSVRIDMKYFISLYSKYEKDKFNFGGELTYRDWIDAEKAKRRNNQIQREKEREEKFKEQEKRKRKLSTKAKTKANAMLDDSESKKTPKKKCITGNTKQFVVEVVRPLPSEGIISRISISSNKQKASSPKRKRSSSSLKKKNKGSKKGIIDEDWRLALKAIKGSLAPRRRVLIFMTAEDDNKSSTTHNEGVYDQCFAGMVTEIVDGHARVHFDGLSKQDDVWLPTNSPKLFLDGGTQEKPQL